MDNKLSFTVWGRPQQRGSKTAVPIGKRGGGYLTAKNGRPIIAVKDDNPRSKDWMQEVRSAAVGVYGVNRPLVLAPIVLTVRFYFARPRKHYRTGKHASKLREDAPEIHSQSPDLAKLLRCIEDALTGIVWVDDRLVYRYGDGTGRYWTQTRERAEVIIEWPDLFTDDAPPKKKVLQKQL